MLRRFRGGESVRRRRFPVFHKNYRADRNPKFDSRLNAIHCAICTYSLDAVGAGEAEIRLQPAIASVHSVILQTSVPSRNPPELACLTLKYDHS